MSTQKTLGVWKNPNNGKESTVHMLDDTRCDGTTMRWGADIFAALRDHHTRSATIMISNPHLLAQLVAQNGLTDLSRYGIAMSKTTHTEFHAALRQHSIDPTTVILDKSQILR